MDDDQLLTPVQLHALEDKALISELTNLSTPEIVDTMRLVTETPQDLPDKGDRVLLQCGFALVRRLWPMRMESESHQARHNLHYPRQKQKPNMGHSNRPL